MINTFLLIPSYLLFLLSKSNTLIEEDLVFWTKTLRINKGDRFKNFIWLMKNLKEYRTIFYWRIGRRSRYISWLAPAHSTLYLQVSPNNVGKGFVIQHGHSTIVLIKSCGDNCQIWQNVTLGKKQSVDNQPIPSIGNNVKICAGAIVLGDVHIGDNSTIGAGSIVLKDVPDNCVVVGNPARIIRRNGVSVNEKL